MKEYRVIVTPDAEEDLNSYLAYLRLKKKNPQAVKNVIIDFKETTSKLSTVASSIAEPESEKLKQRGLKRMNFLRHDYFVLFFIGSNDIIYVTNIFHCLEDFERKLR